MSPRNLLRQPLREFKPYVVGKPIETVRREYGLTGRIAKLASNENPLGTSPTAVEAMRRAVEDVSLYPDDCRLPVPGEGGPEVRGRDGERLLRLGLGRDHRIAAVAFLEPGDGVVSSEKTFAMYSLAAAKAGAEFAPPP